MNPVRTVHAERQRYDGAEDLHTTELRRWRPTTTKEWLRRGIDLEKSISALEEARVRAWTRATSATATIKDTPGGGGDVTANKADAYLALSEKIQREQERLALIKAEIISTTAKVQDAALRALLIEHYVNGRTWRETAEKMNYNEVHVRGKMHARALRAVEHIRTGCA